jgi:hypothetical protein
LVFYVDAGLTEAILNQDGIDQVAKTIHLASARYRRPSSTIGCFSTTLFGGLTIEAFPVVSDGLTDSLFKGRDADSHNRHHDSCSRQNHLAGCVKNVAAMVFFTRRGSGNRGSQN